MHAAAAVTNPPLPKLDARVFAWSKVLTAWTNGRHFDRDAARSMQEVIARLPDDNMDILVRQKESTQSSNEDIVAWSAS